MRNIRWRTILVTSMLFVATSLVAHAQAVTTVTCDTYCSPVFSNYIGTVSLNLICDANSPTSYTGQLTVNGVATPVNSKTCASPAPVVNIQFN